MTSLQGLALMLFALCVTANCLKGGRHHSKQKDHRPEEDVQPEAWWTDPDLCGISKYPNPGEREMEDPEAKIAGGMDAYPGEFPWTVALFNYGVHECGAVLIDPRWVLTAAHCVRDPTYNQFNVSLGEHDLKDLNSPARVNMEIQSSDIHIHPDYTGHHNDIALLKMPKGINFTEDIQPACPPNVTRDITGINCIIGGWGFIENGGKPDILQFASVPIVDYQQCSNVYPDAINETIHLCAGYAEGGIDSCTRDSGGPLACQFGEQFELHGIVSWGPIPCAQPNKPGVYTRVVSYLDWMQQVMDANT